MSRIVVSGMIARLSWSWMPFEPLVLKTPMIEKVLPPILIGFPTTDDTIGLFAEQVLDDGWSEDDDVGVRVVVGLREEPAVLDGVVAHVAEVRRRSLYLLRRGRRAVEHCGRVGGVDRRNDLGDVGGVLFVLQGFDVGVGDGHLPALGAAASTEAEAAGDDGQRVGTETFELLAARGRGSAADADQDDHRGDADHDAERGERGAHLVGDDAASAIVTLERFMTAPRRTATRRTRTCRTSSSTAPSRNRMTTCRAFGHFVLVGDDDHGSSFAMQAVEAVEYFGRGLAVERAGGFVGENDRRVGHDRASDRDSLLLAARELVRRVVEAITEADRLERETSRALAARPS